MGQAPRARTATRTTPDAPMPARRARPRPGPSGKAPARRRPAGPARQRAPLRPWRPRPRRRPAGRGPAGGALAWPVLRSPDEPAAARCRTPGSSAARFPPAGHRLCPRLAANHPQAPAHPPTARPAPGSGGRRTAARAGPNYAANPPATSAAHPAGHLPRRTVRPPAPAARLDVRPAPPGPAPPTISGRVAAGTVAPRPRCEEARATVPAVSPPVDLSPGPSPRPGRAEPGHPRS